MPKGTAEGMQTEKQSASSSFNSLHLDTLWKNSKQFAIGGVTALGALGFYGLIRYYWREANSDAVALNAELALSSAGVPLPDFDIKPDFTLEDKQVVEAENNHTLQDNVGGMVKKRTTPNLSLSQDYVYALQGESVLLNPYITVSPGGSGTPDQVGIGFAISPTSLDKITPSAVSLPNFPTSKIYYVNSGAEVQPLAFTITAHQTFIASISKSMSVIFNRTFYLTKYQFSIIQGQRLLITTDMLCATNPQMDTSTVIFTVSSISQGHFEYVDRPGYVITQFSLSDIQANTVEFVHDGSTIAPSFNVKANQMSSFTDTHFVTPQLKFIPSFVHNSIVITKKGEHVVLGLDNIQATDPGIIDSNSLVFNVVSISNAYFAFTNDPQTPITTFTQGQITNVIFVQDGSDYTPVYRLTVSAGNGLTSEPNQGTVSFTDPSIGNNQSSNSNSNSNLGAILGVVGTLGGAAIGYGYKIYTDNKREERDRRNTSALATLLRTELKLCGVADFNEPRRGKTFVAAVNLLISTLQDKHTFDVHELSDLQLAAFAHTSAEILKGYTTDNAELVGTKATLWQYHTKTGHWLKISEMNAEIENIASRIHTNYQRIAAPALRKTDLESGRMMVKLDSTTPTTNNTGGLNQPLLASEQSESVSAGSHNPLSTTKKK